MATPRGTRRLGQLAPVRTGDEKLDRAQDEVAGKVNALLANPLANAVAIEVDLEWGLNKIGHGLGRHVASFLTTSPAEPGAIVSSAQADNPFPHKQVWVYLDGVATIRTTLILLPVS